MIFTSVHENTNSIYRTKILYETGSHSVQKFTVSKFRLHRSSIKTKRVKEVKRFRLSILTSEERKTDLKTDRSKPCANHLYASTCVWLQWPSKKTAFYRTVLNSLASSLSKSVRESVALLIHKRQYEFVSDCTYFMRPIFQTMVLVRAEINISEMRCFITLACHDDVNY